MRGNVDVRRARSGKPVWCAVVRERESRCAESGLVGPLSARIVVSDLHDFSPEGYLQRMGF